MPVPKHWSESEVEAAVSDYFFSMLGLELSGSPLKNNANRLATGDRFSPGRVYFALDFERGPVFGGLSVHKRATLKSLPRIPQILSCPTCCQQRGWSVNARVRQHGLTLEQIALPSFFFLGHSMLWNASHWRIHRGHSQFCSGPRPLQPYLGRVCRSSGPFPAVPAQDPRPSR